ncbi:MAG: DUF397 domain-containing protein [Candidatus Dormibacteraceae bacterium]
MSKEELAGAKWFKSSRSNGHNNCVETAFLEGGRVALRDTKDNGAGPAHIFTPGGWSAFIEGAKLGKFDQS